MLLEEVQARQYAAVATIEKEKHLLAIEVSALKCGQSEALTRCIKKHKRVALLENESASLKKQLHDVTAKVEASNAEAGDEMEGVRSEKFVSEERLSMQLEDFQARHCAAVAAIEAQKRMLAIEVSDLKCSQSRALTQCRRRDKQVTQLRNELSSLSEQLQDATSGLEALNAGVEALRSEKCVLMEHLSVKSMHLEELQAKQHAAVAAIEEERRILMIEVSALKCGQSNSLTECEKKGERVAQLEYEVSSLSKQLLAATAKLEASNAKSGGELEALRCEKSALIERLSAQSMHLEELQAKHYAGLAAIEKEKHMLMIKVSASKCDESEALNQCIEKDKRVALLEKELSSLMEQLQDATAELKALSAGAELLRSEKSVLKKRLLAQCMQLKELQAKQHAAVAAIEDEKRILVIEVSALKCGKSKLLTQCKEKEEHVAQLEAELSSLSKQLEAATIKLKASNAEAGDEMKALQREKSVLKERLSAQRMHLEELQARQYAAVAAIEEEKHMLAIEISALKCGQSEALTQCIEKDKRVALLESELSSLWEQLHTSAAKVEAFNAESGDEMEAVRSEKSILEERLSVQCMQLEEFQAKQYAAVAAIEEEKRMLAIEVSALKRSQSVAMIKSVELGKFVMLNMLSTRLTTLYCSRNSQWCL